MGEIYTVNEVAEKLKVSRLTIIRKIDKGEIKIKNLNPCGRRVIRIKEEWLEDYLNGK